jgi:hypothetical protein
VEAGVSGDVKIQDALTIIDAIAALGRIHWRNQARLTARNTAETQSFCSISQPTH